VSLSVVKRFKPWRKTKPEWVQIDKDGCEHPFTPKVLHEVGRDEKSGKRMKK
jgi:hypothetical protein